MAENTSSSLKKQLIKTSWKDYLKKRWLYIVGFLFIYIAPLIVILEKVIRMKPATDSQVGVSVSMVGFIIGLTYIVFISKRIKIKINEMKIGAGKTLVTGISNIIPFITVGFLAHLISNGLSGFDFTIWLICGLMVLGTFFQTLDFILNRDYLYDQELIKIAVEKVLAEDKEQEIKDKIQEIKNGY